GCKWIWVTEGKPAENAPAEKRFFRKVFAVPEGKTIAKAKLRISADNKFDARLNGEALGMGNDWQTARQFNDLAPILKPGKNILAIMAENLPDAGANPAGLIASLEIQLAESVSVKVVSDATWRCAKEAVDGWDKTGFDDAPWTEAAIIGRYGDAPWGKIGQVNDDEV